MLKRLDKYIIAILISLSPLVLNLKQFQSLFWFGDELCLLGEMNSVGLAQWSLAVFAESIVPIFKLLWGGFTLLFDGSYFALVVAVWITHAINAILLLNILDRASVSRAYSYFSICLFAITPGTHESLGWTVQWSAILVVTFLLIGIFPLFKSEGKGDLRKVLLMAMCAFGAAFSFARGILASCILAAGYFLSTKKQFVSRVIYSLIPIIPALIALCIIYMNSTGNHQSVLHLTSQTFQSMVDFGGTYFLLNPFFRIFNDITPEANHFYLFGSFKIILVIISVIAAFKSSGIRRILLLLALLFDLGNSILLGLGRYHTGWQFAVSSRYQYESLLCAALCIALSSEIFLPNKKKVFSIVMASSIVLSLFSLYRWNMIMKDWGSSRGSEGRSFFFARPDKRPASWWGLPGIITREDAERVIKKYNLH